ncbi:MAG: glycosyltransferase family 4 protein [Rhodothermales bacterium]
MSAPINLIVFFTEGMSLRRWDDLGRLDREVSLYLRFQQHGVRVTFVTYGDGRDLEFGSRIPGIKVICNSKKLSSIWYRRAVKWLYPLGWNRRSILKSNQVNGAALALAARTAQQRMVARCGYLLSDFEERKAGPDSERAKHAWAIERRIFANADATVVTTDAMKERITSQYDLSSDIVTVIPNYVDTDVFQPVSPAIRDGRTICFIGRLENQKNPAALIEAVTGLDAKLIMIGDGSLREDLESVARRNGTDVTFTGNLPTQSIASILQKADIFVLPSNFEGHPKALIEAMACGVAVIGTNVSGISNLIKDGATGLLCETNAESIRTAIVTARDNPSLRFSLGLNARKYAVRRFSLDTIVTTEIGLYRSLYMS